MKISALIAAAAIAAGTVAAVPAEAQRYGYHHGYGEGRYHRGYGYGYGREHRGYGYGRAHRPLHYGGYYGRSRTVCRIHHGRFGPVRSCFRTFR